MKSLSPWFSAVALYLTSCAPSYEPGPDSYRLAEGYRLGDRFVCVCGALYVCMDDGRPREPDSRALCDLGVVEAIAPDQIQCLLDAQEQYLLCLAEGCSEAHHEVCETERTFERDLCKAALSDDEAETIDRLSDERCPLPE